MDLVAIQVRNIYKSNNICYNLLNPIEIVLTLVIYYQHIKSQHIKNLTIKAIVIFLLFTLINAFFIQGLFLQFASYTFFLGGIVVCIYSYLIWRKEIYEDELSPNKLILWFATANFLYYSVSVPVISANNWLVIYSKEISFTVFIINGVNYSIWAIVIGLGILWKVQASK